MPKAKWNLNTIYISERLQESLRPISRCALTTVVAPMGYGKTTAVEWYLAERARAEEISVIRISVYSANLAIFWRSVQDAFARAGFDLLRDYDCPSDAAGGGLLIEDLCHALAGERPCYIFLGRFPPADQQARILVPLCARRAPPRQRPPHPRQPRRFPARRRHRPAGREGLPDRRRAAPPQPYRARRLHQPLRHRAFRRADRVPAVLQRGLVLRRLSEPADVFRARRARGP